MRAFLLVLFISIQMLYSSDILFMDQILKYEKPGSEDWIFFEHYYNPITKKGNLIYKHVGITNENGQLINPGITIFFEDMHSDSINLINYVLLSRMDDHPNKTLNIYTSESNKIDLGILYETKTKLEHVNLHILTNYFIIDNIGFQITCSSTDEVYSEVEATFYNFLKSFESVDGEYNESNEKAILKGFNFYREGLAEEALGYYNYCLLSDSLYNDSYYYSALLYGETGNYNKSISLFTKSISIAPDEPFSYGDRGSLYAQNGELEKALEDFKKASEIKPDHPHFYKNLATCYQQMGNMEEAINSYSLAIKHIPDFFPAYMQRGIMYLEQDKYELAFNDFETTINIVEKQPEFMEIPRIKMQLAECYLMQGMIKKELDDKEAAKLLIKKADELGHPKAASQLDE